MLYTAMKSHMWQVHHISRHHTLTR